MEEGPSFVGDWEKERRLGSGGFGDVFLWTNRITGQNVAIKICRIISNQNEEEKTKLKTRWKQEILWMKNFKSEFIVQAIDLTPIEFIQSLNKSNPTDLPILAMEYCDGGDLRTQMSRIENINGLNEKEIRIIMKSLRNAVFYLHEQFKITHRDIKPENIVLKLENGKHTYKLTDMGYAKNIDHHTVKASLVGTKDYFAPEIITDFKYTNSVDYWSIGVIAFELICGIKPFIPHQSPPTWLIQINKKHSKYIAITENNEGEFIYHEHLFRENFASDAFRDLLKKWLTLALERNPKMRGNKFINPSPHATMPPKSELLFYKELDGALNANILTVFNLSSYKFCSYAIQDEMPLKNILTDISTDTCVPVAQLCIILPYNHLLTEFTASTTAMDLYMHDCPINQPMLYVKQSGTCLQYVEPEISSTIKFVLSTKEPLKKCIVREFARHTVFLFREENRKKNAFVSGLKNFAMLTETELLKFESQMNNGNNEIAYINGALYFLQKMQGHMNPAQNTNHLTQLTEKWANIVSNMYKTLQALTYVIQKLQLRFKSALRRIQEILQSSLFEDLDKDYFGLKYVEQLVSCISEKPEISFVESASRMIVDCMKKRKEWFKSLQVSGTETSVNEISDEFQAIRKIEANFKVKIAELMSKLDECSSSYPKDFFGSTSEKSSLDLFMNDLNLDNGNDSMQVDSPSSLYDFDDTRKILNEAKRMISLFEGHNLKHDVDMECNQV